ncbi:alpha/beta hydrolase [Exophiala viscosa]|uniref:Alpha/beta hydrolase n=1 Tax=Exophiala viscosa TaxID=2486360 RepID=A0AAN6E4Q0_9EURO|nr:alpha/beta hydrolase [Exophiala viscosa]
MRRLRVTYAQPFRRPFSTTNTCRDVVDLAFHRHDPPEQANKGPPIILMHGLFGSQRNNRTMSKVLAKDLSRPVYTLDLRNHGESPHSPVHDYTSMAEDVEHLLSAQSISKPTLIGHSMGAKVAMTMALRSPSKYSALIPVDNAPVDAALKSDFGTYVKAMREIEEHKPPVAKQSEADKILAKYESDTAIRQFLLTNLVKTTPGGAEHQHKHGEHRHPQKTELRWRIPLHTLAKSLPAMADFPFKDPDEARFEGPTLIVRGTKSHYVADDTLPLIGRFFPQFEVLDCDCGHWVMSEKFEEFRKGVVEWITRVVDER